MCVCVLGAKLSRVLHGLEKLHLIMWDKTVCSISLHLNTPQHHQQVSYWLHAAQYSYVQTTRGRQRAFPHPSERLRQIRSTTKLTLRSESQNVTLNETRILSTDTDMTTYEPSCYRTSAHYRG